MPSGHRFVTLTVAVVGLALGAACSSTTGLPAATTSNVVDTSSLYALFATPIAAPSAYDLNSRFVGRQLVRTDQSSAFDFAFNFDSLQRPVLLPTGAIGLGQASGLQQSSLGFTAITVAPVDGYVLDKALVVSPGTVALVRSRPTNCLFGVTVYLYAKLQVLAVDTTARRITFQILVDQDCGYHNLQPGIPTQ
jgi:hypothetical protein